MELSEKIHFDRYEALLDRSYVKHLGKVANSPLNQLVRWQN